MIEQQQNKIVALCGFRGSGKSTFAQTLLKPQSNIVVYDPNEDPAYDWIPNTVYALKGPGSLAEFFEWCRQGQKPSLAVRYIPGENEKGSLFDDANEFCRMVWEGRNLWIVFEEVHQIANTASPSSMPPQLRKIINRGRHRNISVLATGLRFAETPRPITAGANLYIIFQTAEPLDVEELRRRVGADATDEIMRLGKHEALVFDVASRSFFIADSHGDVLSKTFGGFSGRDMQRIQPGDSFRL
jgi:energy-coupling factor transporter ATP-binding protein EcfA2